MAKDIFNKYEGYAYATYIELEKEITDALCKLSQYASLLEIKHLDNSLAEIALALLHKTLNDIRKIKN